MPYELIVDVIFRFLNFGILIALSIYGYKKYIRDSLLKQRKEQRRFVRGLQEQRRTLKHQVENVLQQIKDDHELCGVLQKKVDQWRATIDNELNERAIEKKEYQLQQIERVKIRQRSLKIYKAYQEIFPKVIQQTRAGLVKKFEDEKRGQQYNDKILSAIVQMSD